ncbi:hypothetical protein [Winogradskyella forsetii]|uniref:hypothetical protein n=1 Tax=Winogradskyella forsetii TaxID=2686077 RepID=UPI0015BC66EC
MHQSLTYGELNEHRHWHMRFYPLLLISATIKKFMVGNEMLRLPQCNITAHQDANRLKELLLGTVGALI